MAVEALGNQIGVFIQRRQKQISHELLQLARSKLTLQLHLTDVHRVLRQALKLVRDEAELQHAKVRARLDASDHYVFADSARLQTAFECILHNALKFAGSHALITVHSSNDSVDGLCIEINDDGIGIEPHSLGKVFDPFEQLGPQEEGIGLGLTLSKTIVEMHGGTICAKSDGIGKGATFVVTLKLDHRRRNPVDRDKGRASD
jgi:signal transduction histidine kinase